MSEHINNLICEKSQHNLVDLNIIKDKILISEFARVKLGLKIYPNKTMCCHLHKEKTPSLHFNDQKKFYYCFGCQKNGDVFSLIQEVKICSFLDAVKIAAEYAGVNIEQYYGNGDYAFLRNAAQLRQKKEILFQIMEDVCIYFQQKLVDEKGEKIGQDAKKYLEYRKVDADLIAKFRIGYCPSNIDDLFEKLSKKYENNFNLILDGGIFRKKSHLLSGVKNYLYCILQQRIIFPIFDKFGKVIAFGGRLVPGFDNEGNLVELKSTKYPKYINAADSLIFKKNEALYGENFALAYAKQKNQMILVEGYLDVILMHKFGYGNVVGPLGTALSEFQFKNLWSFSDEICLALDGDQAGHKAMISSLKKSLPLIAAGKFLSFIFWPAGQDPASLLMNNQQELLSQKLLEKFYPAQIIFKTAISKFKKLSVESIAAIKMHCNLYLDLIKDELIKKEYINYFEQKYINLQKKINEIDLKEQDQAINSAPLAKMSNLSVGKYQLKDVNFKYVYSVFEEIFVELLILLIYFPELQKTINNFQYLLDVIYQNSSIRSILQDMLQYVLSKYNKIKVKDFCDYWQNFDYNFVKFVEKTERKVCNAISSGKLAQDLWNTLVVWRLELIMVKNSKKKIEQDLAVSQNIDDFLKLQQMVKKEKKLYSKIRNLDN